ncbi:unnamed protein product, partial [Closterium sp. NIES-65]
CSFNDLDLLGATGPAVAHATTIVMGGKKGWPGVKDWTGPTIEGGEILVFKWDSGLFGRKHSVTIPGNASSFTTCNTKDVGTWIAKPATKAKKSYTLAHPAMFFSTVGKDCAKRGIKWSPPLAG